MKPLEKSLRGQLERAVKGAREVAESAAQAALQQLGVGEANPHAHLSDHERTLRRKLRIHGRQLGDRRDPKTEIQSMDCLIEEVAYEHWHRMLFARFLAENNLLMYPDPDEPVPVSLEECEDLAADENAKNGWELAARFAARMLPQIFRHDSPVFQLTLPPENQQRLEQILIELPVDVFSASDSLGWVYQFWQAKRKEEVNTAEVKIGTRELPAVTQLFTEDYMVSFLLDNSLGAWWVGKLAGNRGHDSEELKTRSKEILKTAKTEEELRQFFSLPGVPLEYLRFVKVEAASSRLEEFCYFHKDDDIENLSGNLPHWRQNSVTYFVTFRTADSLPQEKLKQWQDEKDAWLKKNPEPHDEPAKKEFYKRFPEKIHNWLDQGFGECLLKKTQYRTVLEKTLRHFDGDRYNLDEFVVMPNHIHVLVTPKNGYELSAILHSWKSFSGTTINKLRGNTGTFWQKESFDHILRSPAQLEKIRTYIRNHFSHNGKRQDAASTIWQPAAGTFNGWPDNLGDLKIIDPCCGSGHFLVAAFLMLVPMRMELEKLLPRDACDRVLRENLHGLELDQRCVELAAFALALTAWRFPGAGGFRQLPEFHLACSGLSVSVAKEEWKKLALDKQKMKNALDWMYDVFQDAPVLGSLINPATSVAAELARWEHNIHWEELSQSLEQALSQEQSDDNYEMGVVAHGLTKSATLLAGKYDWVITNVPYLARGKQDERLKDFCEKRCNPGKNDLATVFLDRCLEFCKEGGTASVVMPQNWLFLTTYRKFREKLLRSDTWHAVARLGASAFDTISGEVVKAILLSISKGNVENVEEASSLFQSRSDFQSPELKRQDADSTITGLDVSDFRTPGEKAEQLIIAELKQVEQTKQLENPDARVALEDGDDGELLEIISYSYHGLTSGDMLRMKFCFWEILQQEDIWIPFQGTVRNSILFAGNETILRWENGRGSILELQGARKDGTVAWAKQGILVSQMRGLPVTTYNKYAFDNNTAVIVPDNPNHLPAIWCFCSSPEYNEAVRRIDQKLNVTNATLVKVPFDLDRWQKIAAEKYPNGLPKPYSDDPTQWIFHGHPCGSVVWNEEKKRLEAASSLRVDDTVLHVAVARLLGYRWPAELESRSGFQPLSSEQKSQDGSSTMELSAEASEWVSKCDSLLSCADEDGIVCIPPVRGEIPAADRLLNILAIAYGDEWSTDVLSKLLKQADHAAKTLETWLRDKFFVQHCKLFHHRPFIWHIWDGMNDGFAALVNYHKLDHKNLETLIYTYLGDWITRQKDDLASGVDGAQEKLAAAENLKKKLELILKGEAPHDIFVRWKPLENQPIGWNPDLNDGVRLNVRPFIKAGDIKKKDAGVLRDKFNVKWTKDRGKDVTSAPWYHLFKGDRINDHHVTLAEKQAEREKTKEKEN